ncbi:hypothetical protein L1277_002242 [Okibacterium sp. HSC-33S16]|nr:hypothetical protein [Okibacterium sp. HSC-33S16]
MINTAELVTNHKGWSVGNKTRCRIAHSQRTMAITENGAEITMLPSFSFALRCRVYE